ncbi:amino acid ABC transporter ATP-binding/permease protein [Actinomyces haliotis]|uniref:amino acid ABC transporter ATP-binding/permease protein n=1 Tax=Actinomyces haliotis TaxID=1280843 RepID=UPI00188E3D9E|nr:ABC transporter ATP-binding protein [Actinomyces haliotis]
MSTSTSTGRGESAATARATGRPGARGLVPWLLRTTAPVLPPLAASALLRVLAQLLGVGLVALAADAVARTALAAVGSPGAGAPGLTRLLPVMVLLALLKAAARYGEQFLGHLVAFKALELLRVRLVSSLLPRATRQRLGSGDLLARATKDVDRVETFFAHTIAPVIGAVLVPLTTVIVIGAAASWRVALAGAAVLVLAIAVVPFLGSGAAARSARVAAAERAALTAHLTDTVQGMREVLGYGLGPQRLEGTRAHDDALLAATAPADRLAAVRHGAVQLLVLTAPLAGLAAGAPETARGDLSLPALAAAVAALWRLGETVRGVEGVAGTISTALASAERVREVIEAPVEIHDGDEPVPHAASHELAWDRVSYTHPGAVRPALRDVTAVARAGERTCLVGASGSGKTTLLRLALRADDPSGGTLTVDGADLRGLRADDLRRELVLVPQEARLFHGSLAENLRLAAPEATDAALEEALAVACVLDEVRAMPQGLATVVGERGTTVSGGQRQRIALARALLARPALLLLDEVGAHLDPALDARVHASLRDWSARTGAGVLEVTHRLTGIEEADHVIVLDDGAVIADGTPAELLADPDGPLARLAARA